MDFSPETIRARFADLTAESAKLDTKRVPLQDELAALVAGDTDLTVKKAREREAAVRAKIIEINDQLFPIEQERALCARALGGKTGEPASE